MRNPILTAGFNSWGEPHLATAKQGNPQMRKWRINFAPHLPVSRGLFVLFPFWPLRMDIRQFSIHTYRLFVTVLSALLFFSIFSPTSYLTYTIMFYRKSTKLLITSLWYRVSLKSNFSLPTVLGIINRTLLTCRVCRLIFKRAHPLIESDTLEGFKGVGRFFNPFFDVF